MLDSWVVGYGERVPFIWYAFSQFYLGRCNYVELIDTIFTDVEGVD